MMKKTSLAAGLCTGHKGKTQDEQKVLDGEFTAGPSYKEETK